MAFMENISYKIEEIHRKFILNWDLAWVGLHKGSTQECVEVNGEPWQLCRQDDDGVCLCVCVSVCNLVALGHLYLSFLCVWQVICMHLHTLCFHAVLQISQKAQRNSGLRPGKSRNLEGSPWHKRACAPSLICIQPITHEYSLDPELIRLCPLIYEYSFDHRIIT